LTATPENVKKKPAQVAAISFSARAAEDRSCIHSGSELAGTRCDEYLQS
jgi:hypothetical protein